MPWILGKGIEYRDLLFSVGKSRPEPEDHGGFNEDQGYRVMAKDDTDAVVQIFLCGKRKAHRKRPFPRNCRAGRRAASDSNQFIKQFYAGTPFIPGMLLGSA